MDGGVVQSIAPVLSTVLSVLIALAEVLVIAYFFGPIAAFMVLVTTTSYTALCWRRTHETGKRRTD